MLSPGKQNIFHQPEGQLIRFASRDRHTSLGIWFPMYKAVRMKPAEALHYE